MKKPSRYAMMTTDERALQAAAARLTPKQVKRIVKAEKRGK